MKRQGKPACLSLRRPANPRKRAGLDRDAGPRRGAALEAGAPEAAASWLKACARPTCRCDRTARPTTGWPSSRLRRRLRLRGLSELDETVAISSPRPCPTSSLPVPSGTRHDDAAYIIEGLEDSDKKTCCRSWIRPTARPWNATRYPKETAGASCRRTSWRGPFWSRPGHRLHAEAETCPRVLEIRVIPRSRPRQRRTLPAARQPTYWSKP